MKQVICTLIALVFIAVALNSAPNSKFRIGVDALGYPFLSGPTFTLEVPFDNVRYHLNARIGAGLVNIVREEYKDLYSMGIGANYFFNGKHNGFFSGATVEYGKADYMYTEYFVKPILWTEDYRYTNYVSLLANAGYNWEYASNLYLRLGGNLGAKFAKKQTPYLVGNPQLVIGYSF